jgi:hypothetical protein
MGPATPIQYLASDIEDLARNTGFEALSQASDERGWFCSALWSATKGDSKMDAKR